MAKPNCELIEGVAEAECSKAARGLCPAPLAVGPCAKRWQLNTIAILSARVRPVERRILAADISAPLHLPPFTNSAADGYAVRSRDLGRDPAQALSSSVGFRQALLQSRPWRRAVRIITGAPMPVGVMFFADRGPSPISVRA